jgi:hypothetical protein
MENSNKAVDNSTTITPEDVLAQLRAMRAQIPEFTQRPAYSGPALHSAATIDPQFIDAATAAIGTSDQLQHALSVTPENCVAEASEASRWAQVEDEAAAFFSGIRNANLGRRHRIGVRALQAYQMTKQLVRFNEQADLKPHLAEMRKHNRLGRGRRTPAPVPQPAPQQSVAEHNAM